ncbi:hypothetical protein HanIR_Chr08g0367291 [Helianthus annuus]|nr:hypothetical protein HanIR_Chr08g0367291 [Helianthus annuus]
MVVVLAKKDAGGGGVSAGEMNEWGVGLWWRPKKHGGLEGFLVCNCCGGGGVMVWS